MDTLKIRHCDQSDAGTAEFPINKNINNNV